MSGQALAGSLRPTVTTIHTVETDCLGAVAVTLQGRDRTRPYLLLPGCGVGEATMTGFADLLAERTRTSIPAHTSQFRGNPEA